MKLNAKLKNERGGVKSTCDNTRIRIELSHGNKVIGELSLYDIHSIEDVGYRVVWVKTGAVCTGDGLGEVIDEEVKGNKQKGKWFECQACGKDVPVKRNATLEVIPEYCPYCNN